MEKLWIFQKLLQPLDFKICTCSQENDRLSEVRWVSEVKVIPWPKVTQIPKLKLFFSETTEPFETKFQMKAFGNMEM